MQVVKKALINFLIHEFDRKVHASPVFPSLLD